MMRTDSEQALLDKHRRGETITPVDHLLTIRDEDELKSFMENLARDGRATPELKIFADMRGSQLRLAQHKAGSRKQPRGHK